MFEMRRAHSPRGYRRKASNKQGTGTDLCGMLGPPSTTREPQDMRVTFTYTKPGTATIKPEVTKRDGQLFGVTYKNSTIYFHVREDGSDAVKQFIAQRVSDITTVLEPHEQMPGVLNVEPPVPAVAQVSAPAMAPAPAASVEIVKRLADLEAELLWYRSMAAALGARHA